MQSTNHPGSSERYQSSSFDARSDERFDPSLRRDARGYGDSQHDHDRLDRQRWQERHDERSRSQSWSPSQDDFREQYRDQYRDPRYDAARRQEGSSYEFADQSSSSRGRQFDGPRGGYSGRNESYYGQPNEHRASAGASSGQSWSVPQRSPGQVSQSDYGFGGGSGSQGTERQHVGKGPKGFQRSDDRVHEECCQSLQDDGQLDASEIEVTVKGGEVTLTGTVSDRNQKRMAESCCDGVRGVKDVHNQIRVKSGDQGSSSTSSSSRGTNANAQSGSHATSGSKS